VWDLLVANGIFHSFPPDPTLTVDNVRRIMEKVDPKVKIQVWNDVSWITVDVERRVRPNMCWKEKECADLYVNCHLHSSWEHLAGSLYHHHQVAAIEEVRQYLPPRGESGCESSMYMTL
jgi:hypothetical protein